MIETDDQRGDDAGDSHGVLLGGGALLRPSTADFPTTAKPKPPYFLPVPLMSLESEVDSAAMKASCGTSTRPTIFIRFLPSFCFSSSLRLRVMSPP